MSHFAQISGMGHANLFFLKAYAGAEQNTQYQNVPENVTLKRIYLYDLSRLLFILLTVQTECYIFTILF